MNFDLKLGKAASVLFVALAMAGCGGGGGADMTLEETPDPADGQRTAIIAAIGVAETAVAAVNDTSDDGTVSAADKAIADARAAITAATNVPEKERDADTRTVDTLAGVLSSAKASRVAAMDEAARKAEEERKAAEMALMETARKLYAGISAPSADRAAAYGTGDNADDIQVTIDGAGTFLMEDEDAVIAAHHGWEGAKFTRTTDAGTMFEAVVYSDIGEATAGASFSDTYTLADGAIADVTSVTDYAGLVASPSFDHGAGSKTFELPDNTVAVKIAGSFHGVAGTYSCEPSTTCTATFAASGFTLTGGAWSFEPTNPEASLMDEPDNVYASYGWWIRKSADGTAYTASAFAANKGTKTAAADLNTLNGTATYTGGAAGKYALHSSTGGTNDAGHFTADATLEADFTDNSITGTIDNFMCMCAGGAGAPRDWSVELKEATLAADGAISRAEEKDTVWTIGGIDADASGTWGGSLQENGEDNVPNFGIGTFYSEYGRDGRMVGAFGVKRQ